MPTPLEALAGVPNANQALPHLVTGGQPTAEQFRVLKAAGIEVVIDLRDPMEPRGFDEGALLQQLGMDYVVMPVGPGTVTDQTLDRLLAALRGLNGRSCLLHCASGNRVGGGMIPHLVLDHGMSDDEATMAAMRMGLRSAEYLQWGIDYAAAHKR